MYIEVAVGLVIETFTTPSFSLGPTLTLGRSEAIKLELSSQHRRI
jgi:hypothetical protein